MRDDYERGHWHARVTRSWQLPSAAGCGVSTPAARAECGLVWTRHWRRAASGVVCQIWIAGRVQFPPVTRIKSLRTPNKSGLWPEVNGWRGLAQSGA